MLGGVLAGLALAAGTAVVNAAGTDAWQGFRTRVARLFARGDGKREADESQRLDQSAAALAAASPDDLERLRDRQEAAWQTRFETLLEDLHGDEQERVAAELRELLRTVPGNIGSVSAGQGGLAAGGPVNISADRGSAAAGVVHGGIQLGNPLKPDRPQG